MIASQLNIFLEHHHLLHTLQGAYRHGRSADQILMYAVDTIVQAGDAGDCVCAAFLDLRKAFDSLDHCILLGRLQKPGVTGVELRWFTDYLSGRMQRVKQNDRYSDWGLVLGGISQGSALGPLLFLIYVNEMPSQMRKKINCHVKSLPSDIIKMLVESLVFSRYTYALSVRGPAIHQDSLSRILRLQNRAVHMTCNLRKYDRISHHRGNLRWLSISSFIRYRSMLTMFDNYYLEKGAALESPILFGVQHSYRTIPARCPKYFAAIPCCRLSFTKRFFRCQAIHWWNALPLAFFHDITTFSSNLFRHLLDFT